VPRESHELERSFAVSRITQNDQIGLLEPGRGHEVSNGFACGSAHADEKIRRGGDHRQRAHGIRFCAAPGWADQPVAAPAVSYVLFIFLLPLALYLMRLGA
jgi:hypothetical protein